MLLSINYRNQSPSFNLDHRLLLLLLLLLLDKITLIVDQVHFIELNYRPAGRRRLSRRQVLSGMRGMTRPRPGVYESILARRQEAVLAKDQRRQPLVGNLLADQRLQQRALVEARTGGRSDELHGIEAAHPRARARSRSRSRRMGGRGQRGVVRRPAQLQRSKAVRRRAAPDGPGRRRVQCARVAKVGRAAVVALAVVVVAATVVMLVVALQHAHRLAVLAVGRRVASLIAGGLLVRVAQEAEVREPLGEAIEGAEAAARVGGLVRAVGSLAVVSRGGQ